MWLHASRKYKHAAKEVTKERLRLRRALKTQIRDEFDAQQAVQDIEGQHAKGSFGSGMAAGTWENVKMREVARIMWRRARSASFLALTAL